MEKSVIISIQGKQTDTDGTDEVIELVTQGLLVGDSQQGYHVTYEESELTGMEGTTTTFQIDGDQITLLRRGALNTEMVFKEGEKHVALYDTELGGFMVGVDTQKARSDIGQDGGNLELQYVIEVENTVIGTNAFLIEVKEPEYPLVSSV